MHVYVHMCGYTYIIIYQIQVGIMYVCVCVYIYIYVYMRTIHRHTHIYIYIYIRMYTHMYVSNTIVDARSFVTWIHWPQFLLFFFSHLSLTRL